MARRRSGKRVCKQPAPPKAERSAREEQKGGSAQTKRSNAANVFMMMKKQLHRLIALTVALVLLLAPTAYAAPTDSATEAANDSVDSSTVPQAIEPDAIPADSAVVPDVIPGEDIAASGVVSTERAAEPGEAPTDATESDATESDAAPTEGAIVPEPVPTDDTDEPGVETGDVSEEPLVVELNPDTGVIDIATTLVPDEVSAATAQVFLNGKPEEARSYPMELADGRWTTSVDIRDFDSFYTDYQVRIIDPDAEDEEQAWATGSVKVGPVGKAAGTAQPTSMAQQLYRLTVTGVQLPGDPNVWFLVRGPEEESATRYEAHLKDGVYWALMPIAAHKQAGTYQYVTLCGKPGVYTRVLRHATFRVAGTRNSSAAFENIDGQNGTFTVRAKADASAGIRNLRVKVWSKDDQSDTVWRMMQTDGDSWTADFNVFNDFDGHFGTYHAYVHATLGNSIGMYAANTAAQIDARNYIWSGKSSSGEYLVNILNPDPSQNLQVAVWSEANGQDDLAWYPATSSGHGRWTASFNARRHRSSGQFQAHVYSGDTFLGATSFDVPAGEVPSYPQISNPSTSYEDWYFMRNSSHTTPEGAWSANELWPYGAYYVGDTSKKVIYLAFDAGYDNGYCAQILDVLKNNGVQAAFFITKGFLDDAPNVARRMANEGHVVGNHTVNHADMRTLSEYELYNEVTGLANEYKSITGRDMDPFLRPPAGQFSGLSMLRTRELGYQTIFWSLAYGDYDESNEPSTSEAYYQMTNYIHPGCITLIHTTCAANVSALDSAIKTWKSEGYTFASLYDLP